jgi:hypothetical protein
MRKNPLVIGLERKPGKAEMGYWRVKEYNS